MSSNYVEALVDEIALEGLDGITLQALWIRLAERKGFNFYLDEKSKEFLWNIIKKLKNVEFFILPIARGDLVLPEIKEDTDLGDASMQMQLVLKQLYPHCIVDVNGIRGSCPAFDSRVKAHGNIKLLSVEECQAKWGGRLVLVASQQTRTHALMVGCKVPYTDMVVSHYCVLERIGRSRHYGVFTYGPGSIQDMVKEDPRSHFYIRKKFFELDLITKQPHTLKLKGVSSHCFLLHLNRFFVVIKSESAMRQEQIFSILKSAPEHFVEYDYLRNALAMPGTAFKKVVSLMHRKGLINSHARVTYRTVHPDATPSEWSRKNTGLEKTLRVVVLGCSDKVEKSVDEEENVPNSDDEEADETDGKGPKGILSLANRTLERTVMHQAYRAIEEAGPEGLTQATIGKLLGLGRLDRRLTCRQLLKEGSVSVKMQDVGRQRVTRYYAVRQHMKDLKFEREKLKFIDLVGDVKILEKLLSRDLRNPNCVVKIMQEEAEEVVESIPEEGVYDEDGELLDADIAAAMHAIEQPTPGTSRDTVLVPCDDIDNSTEQDVDPLSTSISDGGIIVPFEDDSLMTYRTLRRINIILNEVLKCKVVDDISKFYKLIADGEREEGYEYKIDRKSLFRLIGKLQREKCVKLYKAVIKSDDKKKTLTFVCSADIERDHASIQCAIEQAKFRIFNIPEVKPPLIVQGDPLLDQDSIILSVQEIQKLNSEANNTDTGSNPLQKEHSNRYGHCPKFVRMRLLHKLLFYLTRDYLGDANTEQEAAIHKLQSMGHKLPDDLPQIYYSNAVDWKMFVPPLPKHGGWPGGWSILCDIVLRIPLSVFVRIMWIRYVIPGLDAYMSHPIKQHYLLGNLPRAIRSNLLAKRKFLFTLYETAQRLCFMGLLQFGPQRLKEKDQLFVYVNKYASIYDTTSSRIGYFQVSSDIEYEKKLHIFSSAQDVDQYWCDLFNTCVLTQLGGKVGQEGKEIILESLENKPALLESCKVRTPEEAVIHDIGEMPGDRLGASGLDSAFFAHLKRNWCSKYLMINANQDSKNQAATSLAWGEEMPMEPRYEPTPKRKESKKEPENKIIETQPPIPKPIPNAIKKKPTFMPRPPKESKIIKRKIRRARVTKKRKTVVPDEPKEPGTFRARVTWTPEEDVYMLLCKVAGIFLSQDSIKTPIKGSLVAQVLNKCVYSTKPKTSDQCLRRMNYLYNRSESAQLDIAMCLEESRQDTLILEKFWNFQQNLRARKLTQDQYENAMDKGFEELVDMLKQKYRSVPDDMLDVSIPDTIEEFHQNFSVVNPYLSLRQRGKYSEPTTLEQVYFNVLVTLIFSSLGTSADKTNYSFQLLNIYQQYPDKWLRAAINKLRTDQMVSSKKLFARTLRHKTNQIPLTSTPFQLAMYYFHMMQSKYQYETFYESWCALQRLRDVGEMGISLDLMTENGGRSACILEGICAGLVEMEIEMPAQIITLDFDSTIGEDEKTRLQQAYEEIIKNSHKLEHLTSKKADQADSVPDSICSEVQDLDIEQIPNVSNIKRPRDEDIDELTVATVSNLKDETSPIKRLRMEETLEESSLIILPDPLEVEQTDPVPPNETVTNTDPTGTDTRSAEEPAMSERDAIIRANVASRMVFYATRDELRDQRSIDEGRDQRARLAMKPCEIICKFKQDNIINDIELNTIITALKDHNIIDGEMSSWEEVQLQYMEAGANTEDLDIAVALVELIKQQHQIGGTISMLRDWFSSQNGNMSLASHLALLVSLKVLLRVGVTTIHYVYWTFKQPWLISSSKVKRLQRDGLTPLSAVVLDLDDVNCLNVTAPQTLQSELSQTEEITEPNLNQSGEGTSSQDHVEAGTSSLTVGTENKIKVTRRFEHSNTLVTSDKTAEEVAKQLELNCGEKVLVAIRPWVRIDGTLNRRVLDRLLGAVLCHILYNPGTTLKLVQDRFCPALQPFHTFELLEILQVIGCVTISALLLKEKVTLLSKPSAPEIVPADFTEDEALIFVEPAMDAVLRMAQFIGDKSYASDFLDDIKIRPYTEAPSQLLVVPDSQTS